MPPLLMPVYEPARAADFSGSEAIARGARALRDRYGAVLGSTLMYQGLVFAASMIPGVGGIASLFATPLDAATRLHLARLDRGEDSKFDSVFRVFGPRYWAVLGGQLLVSLTGVVVIVPALISIALIIAGSQQRGGTLLAGGITAGIIAVLAWVAVLAVTSRLQFVPMLLLDAPDGQCNIGHAFRLAWDRTRPFAVRLMMLSVALLMIQALSLLLLIIGVFLLGTPLAYASTAAAYNMIFPIGPTGRCVRCGYDLHGSPGMRCPECGTPAGAWI